MRGNCKHPEAWSSQKKSANIDPGNGNGRRVRLGALMCGTHALDELVLEGLYCAYYIESSN